MAEPTTPQTPLPGEEWPPPLPPGVTAGEGEGSQPPLPAAAWPPPPPVAALPYSEPVQSGRPGVLTAIGVISIVVASFGVLANLYSGASLLMFSTMARFAAMRPPGAVMAPPTPVMTPAMPTTAPATDTSAAAESSSAAPTIPVSPRGLEADNRAHVATGLGELYFLSGPRLEQLDVLLAKAGRDMFPPGGQPLTPERVQGLVQNHTVGLSADPAVRGPDTFRTTGGRFELYDDRAVFYPFRGGEIVRASALTTSGPGLSASQVETVVQQAQSASGNTMNPAQLAALRNLLAAPGQQYVSPMTIPTAIRSATPMGDGSVYVTFPGGDATIGPQGQIVMTSTATAGAGGTTLAGGFGAPGGGGGRVRINGVALALAGFATAAGIALAIYLLVIGILVLRDSPRGRRLHLVYAGLKIPLTILGAIASWWMTTSFLDAVSAVPGGPNNLAGSGMGQMSTFIAVQHAIFAGIGLIYPVALLIALQGRRVKDYYNSVSG